MKGEVREKHIRISVSEGGLLAGWWLDWQGTWDSHPAARAGQEEQGVTWIRLLVSRVRPVAADASLRMLPLLSAESACSMPSSSWVTVATHSSLAAASLAFTICWTASFRATSEHSKHCRWSFRRSRESYAQEGALGEAGMLTQLALAWRAGRPGRRRGAVQGKGKHYSRGASARACGLGPVCHHGMAGHQPGSCQKVLNLAASVSHLQSQGAAKMRLTPPPLQL